MSKHDDIQAVINALRLAAAELTTQSHQAFMIGKNDKAAQLADAAADCVGAIAIMENMK